MPTYNFSQSDYLISVLIQIHILKSNSADPDQLASSEANWSGSTLFAKAWNNYRISSPTRVKRKIPSNLALRPFWLFQSLVNLEWTCVTTNQLTNRFGHKSIVSTKTRLNHLLFTISLSKPFSTFKLSLLQLTVDMTVGVKIELHTKWKKWKGY